MSTDAPKIDKRTAADISARLAGTPGAPGLLEGYTRQYPFERWCEYDPVRFEPLGRSAALIGVFARFGEIVIERLNKVPEKNFLAFLDLIGAARRPPQPARVPLTFSLSAGSVVDAPVPAGTQVAAPPAPGEKDPVVFETERPLVVTAAQLTSLLTLDPEQDSYGDWGDRLTAPLAFTVFRGDRPLEHILYIGDSKLFGYARIKNLQLRFALQGSPSGADTHQVRWERWEGTQWREFRPVTDSTVGLTKSGTVDFGTADPLPENPVHLRASRWLRCRLLTPITTSDVPLDGMVRESELPGIVSILAVVHLEAHGLVPDLGFANTAALDLSKAFLPFGEKPKSNDTLFLASAEAFSKDRTSNEAVSSGHIDLDIRLANSHLQPSATSVRPSSDLKLAWECWDGATWRLAGTSQAPAWLSQLELDPAPTLTSVDGAAFAILQGTAQAGVQIRTQGLAGGADSALRFLPVGSDGRFADRRRLIAGFNIFEFTANAQGKSSKAWAVVFNGAAQPVELVFVKPPQQPVETSSVDLTIDVRGSSADSVKTIRITNGRTGDPPFSGNPGDPITVKLAEGRNELLIEGIAAGQGSASSAAVKTLVVSRRATAPTVAGFSDGTFGLTQDGVVSLTLPGSAAKSAVNGQENFWLRVRLVDGDYGKDAGYVLKNPLDPGEGFNLVPANFRPPVIATVGIGYDVTSARPPEACFAYNQLSFVDRTKDAASRDGAFAPFAAISESTRPALYLGFSLPEGRAKFPNTTISLYDHVAQPRYGERSVPLSPEVSTRVGAAGTTVTHAFTITNAASQSEGFKIVVLGSQWRTSIAISEVTIEAGATRDLPVRVTVDGTKAGDSDSGFLRLTADSDPDKIHTAAFTTTVDNARGPEKPIIAWRYWNGTQWSKLAVKDDSEQFMRSGLAEFLAPADFAWRALMGREGYWLRAEWDKGGFANPPRLDRVLLNTTLALQTTTIVNEILGSSNGAERQRFRSTRIPVLAGPQLVVREAELPSAEDQLVIRKEEGDDAINVVRDATGRPREIWTRWHEVPDFHGSGPRDRHYVIDHLTGEIRFGDGLNGRIPPVSTGNIRLARYQTGGGTKGNRAVGAVVQLKTTVPYIDKVTNPEAAAGGAEAETTDAMLERMPRTVRHRDRAVTLEDYEDLALLASPVVARAYCVPLRNLKADPLGETTQPGAVSVIVVPRTADAKPLPTLELVARVRDFLVARADATASVAVVGPLYIRVDVRADIVVKNPDGASAIEHAVRERLADFLHPLSGGLDGRGWDFGRAPHRSDLFALIESVPGVDHIRYLQIVETEDRSGVRATGRFLVFSGQHQIDLMFEDG